jgi:hypothetical protein
MSRINLHETYGTVGNKQASYAGEIEFIVKDKHGRVIDNIRQPNIVKIFAKEVLSHGLPHSKIWDRNANSGAGAWTAHNLDLDEYSAKYICFGASFDDNGVPLDADDERYYFRDSVTGGYTPISLGVGAEYGGGLINPITIAEPTRPLKRIERIYYETSYQPSGTPLLQNDVRALNNIVVLETTLLTEEYNGFGLTGNDFFTITEVALVCAKEVGSLGACNCDPREIFLTGDQDGSGFKATASGTTTITLDPTAVNIDNIKEGDQIKITEPNSTENSTFNQISPYYLVLSKTPGGRDVVLDRVPVDDVNTPISGNISVYRDGFKIFSHRILRSPVKKSSDFEIVVRWRIIMN